MMSDTATPSSATQEAAITVKGLTVGYGDFVVQHDLDFTINRRDIFIIMGPSGCGKSTVMRALVGLLEPKKGSVLYGDTDFWKTGENERKRLLESTGLLFQNGALWTSMTLAENVALPLERYTTLTPAEIRDQASFKLSLVGLGGFEDLYPSELSGGMRKRAGLARALALDPEIVFFDEPSAGLDPISAAMLDTLILQLRDNLNMTVVMVTHELESIFAVGNNSIFLDTDQRTIMARGNPRTLRDSADDPEVRRFLNRGQDPEAAKKDRQHEPEGQ